MTWQFIFALLALIATAIMGALDDMITDRGIRKGLGVEKSSMITGLWHTNKPKLWQLFVFSWIQTSVVGSFAIAGGCGVSDYTAGIFFFMSAIGWSVDAIKHTIGYVEWKKLGA